ncbi:thiopeptide-type bacteriocin biosynthesis protein [Paenibacillus sp. MMS20-IR301]|uniref:thiopeptide-type bacteriocin biosynthesis protein n=1 Tax=Paenibacillus sp. MMS20-IR301 TaxID=2895946 RepID=UPI0028E5BD95|nr:thiopeptide-type bacteriocin biosynthesis protein [Paenibacillus sp. MMS20-IR301]WNS43482.1 thiopeptide-type bacteriocin biosynthesis protein [Paenibacillus sp. MMS20-IR301]
MIWHSYHIYYYDQLKQDSLILYICNQMEQAALNNTISKWFYIRYWEGGPHIRLRYLSEFEHSEIIEAINDFVQANKSGIRISKQAYYESINLNSEGDTRQLEQLPWYPEGEIVNILYKPEYERYGGNEAIGMSETLFMYSSLLAAEIISKLKSSSFIIRWLTALNFMNELLSYLDNHQYLNIPAIDFLNNCTQFWRNSSGELPDSVRKMLKLNYEKSNKDIQIRLEQVLFVECAALFQQIAAGISTLYCVINDDTAFRKIIFSHMHMFNNRLGVEPLYENELYSTLIGGV